MAVLALLAALGLGALAPAAAPASRGELARKPGIAGCVSETGSGGACQNGAGLEHPYGVAASPDGTSVYVASINSKAVTIFDRNPLTGVLTQKLGQAGCISDTGSGGACQAGAGLDGAAGIVVSPDGKSVYVAAFNSSALDVFDRNPQTGALTQKPGRLGCISDTGSGGACEDGTALYGAVGVTVSADGHSVYVASHGAGAVTVFDRSQQPATLGALTQKAVSAGCVSDTGTSGSCQDGAGLAGAWGVAASADGRSVYAASYVSDAVAILDRDPLTGALTQPAGTAGCISETGSGGCRDGTALDQPESVAVSPDGRSAYVASLTSGAVAVLDRDPLTGALVQKAGTAGCISDTGTGGACQDGAALSAAQDVTVSPDGTSVYAATGGYLNGSVAVLDRDPQTGGVAQKPGTAGCVSQTGSAGACQAGAGLGEYADDVAVSADGRTVYVASRLGDSVAIFDRETAVPPADRTAPKVSLSGSPVRLTARGVAAVRIGCPAREPDGVCRGTLVLRTAERVRVARTRYVTLGSHGFTIRAGRSAAVQVRLSRTNQRLVARLKAVAVKATVTVRDRAGNVGKAARTLTLRPPRRS